jgi:NAD(P)-dependent dehydrogenase (short-subunit alcohol dehydrogenase family)
MNTDSQEKPMPFTDEVILITGAGSGIGRELSRQLLRAGARVGGLDNQAQSLESLAAEVNNPDFAWVVADVTDRPALIAAVRQLEERLGPVDRLIACAGIGRFTAATTFPAQEFESVIRVNLLGVANGVEAVVPGMVERKKGHLIGLSSLASFRGLPRMAGYSASKAGLNALFDSLRVDLRPFGIHVTTICPSFMDTPMNAGRTHRLMSLDDGIRRILSAIRCRKRLVSFPLHHSLAVRAICLLPTALSDYLTARYLQ